MSAGLSAVNSLPMLDAALAYARMGFSVIPIDAGLKDESGKKWAKRPLVNWKTFQTERASEEAIQHWWGERWPDAGVGIVTGPISGIFALDFDSAETFYEFTEEHRDYPQGPLSQTARGYHLLMRYPEWKIQNAVRVNGASLDVRGEGGYIVVAPSIHGDTGEPYRWVNDDALSFPPESMRALAQSSRGSAMPPPEGGALAGARNDTLFKAALDYAYRGIKYDDALRALLAVNQGFKPPLDQSEAITCVRSAYARAAGKRSSAGEPKGTAAPAPEGVALITTNLAGLTPQQVDWLSYGRLQRAALNLLAGPPHQGKTFCAYDLIAHLSRGEAWPPGAKLEAKGPMHSLILAGEDDRDTSILPRLIALHADLNFVTTLDSVRVSDGGEPVAPSLRQHLHLIGEWMEAHDGGLLLVDPLFSALHGQRFDPHRYAETYEALIPIVRWAHATRCTVLGVMHLTKSRTDRLLNALQGSAALSAIPRCVLFVEQERDEEGKLLPGRLLRGEKSSNAPLPATRRFWLKESSEAQGVPSLEWDPHDVDAATDQATFHPDTDESPGKRASKVIQCAEWLMQRLEIGVWTSAYELRLESSKKSWDPNCIQRASHHELLRHRGFYIEKSFVRQADDERAWWWMLRKFE